MSKIEELITQYCPNGVEWKTLGEIGEFIRGKRFVKTDMVSEGVPCIHYGEMYTHYKIWAKESKSYLEPDLAAKLRVARPGNVVIVAAGETIEDIGNGVAWLGASDVVIHDACFAFTHSLNPKYVSYYLQTQLFRSQIKRYISSGKISSINAQGLSQAKIPIPPLVVQQEIVNILDKFTSLETELEAELKAELKARQIQYDYYHNQLLYFEGEEIEWKTLGEISHYPKSRISASVVDKSTYIGVENLLQNRQGKTFSNYVPSSGNLIEFKKNDILIGNIRPYLKKIWKATCDGGTNGDVIVIRINSSYKGNLNSSYLYYHLASDTFFDYDMQFAKGAKMPRGDKNAILKFKIPIPSLSEQERIVRILDKFDSLANDISVALPAEVEARKKQYEYYRESMLNFTNISNG